MPTKKQPRPAQYATTTAATLAANGLHRITVTLTDEAYKLLTEECDSRQTTETMRAPYGRILSELIMRGLSRRRELREPAA